MHSGLARSGLLGIWSQLLCLATAILPAILSSYMEVSNAVVTHFLVGGLVLSRLGLWLFDLCVNQLLQEEVPSHQLGEKLAPLSSMTAYEKIIVSLAFQERNKSQNRHCCQVFYSASSQLSLFCYAEWHNLITGRAA